MKTTVRHVSITTSDMTGYGVAKEILETMTKLKDIDHHATFLVEPYAGSLKVKYIWETKEEL